MSKQQFIGFDVKVLELAAPLPSKGLILLSNLCYWGSAEAPFLAWHCAATDKLLCHFSVGRMDSKRRKAGCQLVFSC